MAGTPESSIARGLPVGLTGATVATRYVGGTAAAAPVAGTFAVGDFVVAATGKVFICTVAGTPGTWVEVAGSGAVSSVFTRTGAVVAAQDDYTFSQISGGAAAAGGVAWTVVTKASDESVSANTTLQADDELFFTAVSGGVYEVEVFVIYASPAGGATPDMKMLIGEDTVTRGVFGVLDLTTTDAAFMAGVGLTSTNGSPSNPGTAATNRAAKIFGVHTGGGGSLKLYWAQNTSDANPTIVRAGSIMRYRRFL